MEIKDFLHLYMGSPIVDASDENFEVCDSLSGDFLEHLINSPRLSDFRLVLRPLSSMTEEEKIELIKLRYTNYPGILEVRINTIVRDKTAFYAELYSCGTHDGQCKIDFFELAPIETLWLLSKSFDLFGLIDAGLAIDRVTTLKH